MMDKLKQIINALKPAVSVESLHPLWRLAHDIGTFCTTLNLPPISSPRIKLVTPLSVGFTWSAPTPLSKVLLAYIWIFTEAKNQRLSDYNPWQ